MLLFVNTGNLLLNAQIIVFPKTFIKEHPRLLTNSIANRQDLQNLLESDSTAKRTYKEALKSIEKYVEIHQTDSIWIVSRLQMYWKTHATNVYIKGGVYSSADGKAPVPTVRFTGARDAVTPYAAPKIEDIVPYMDDPRGLYYINRNVPGSPLEWAGQSKTGRVVESINRQIIGMAEIAAFIYWYTDDIKYAKFACNLFDTYMTGMYYRSEAVDLNHSHNQTLVGLSSFEVIHEDILNELTLCYDFLFDYLKKNRADKMCIYADVFKKWADLIIKNGVPFNNWNLIEARFVANIAFILEDNTYYADGRGWQYYIDHILNMDYPRQWSFKKLMDYGFDPQTGIWAESPGYSKNVINDFAGFITLFDNILKFDLLPQLPVISKAVLASAQYMYPNGNIVGFGDSHYGILSSQAMKQMIANARHFNKPDQEILFNRMLNMVEAFNEPGQNEKYSTEKGYKSLFTQAGLVPCNSITAGNYSDFVSPAFYAPNVSWFVQRNGFEKENGLMISQAGSFGNHMHSNGIAMELYGKGIVLAPEGGIGTSYFQPDYAEYYSQFPAHNTVVVDGISKYPEMKSNHPFELKTCYPASGQQNGYFPLVTYSDICFREPETNAEQDRVMGIIRTSDSTGYYVDIFRSKRIDGADKYHDYFYHNLGQKLIVKGSKGQPLELMPTDKLSFAEGNLFAYDYLWDKKSVISESDFTATYILNLPDKDDVFMDIWMRGGIGREIFAVKSPASKAWGNTMIPEDIAGLPLNTLVVRQTGQAWIRPFVTILEPSSAKQPGNVKTVNYFDSEYTDSSFVGIKVETRDGGRQYILSSVSQEKEVLYNNLSFKGSYGIVAENRVGVQYLFLGQGKKISKSGYSITASSITSAVVSISGDSLYFASQSPAELIIPDVYNGNSVMLKYNKGSVSKTIKGRNEKMGKQAVISFQLPCLEYGLMKIIYK